MHAVMISIQLLFWCGSFIKERKHEIKGTVRILFQPAEEVAQGAKHVIEAGVLDGVDAIFGMHNNLTCQLARLALEKSIDGECGQV